MAFTLHDLGNIGEFIGAIGVVVTLIYLAIQIRQNTVSVRTAAGMDMSKQVAAWVARLAVEPELGRINNRAAEDPDSLTPEESGRFVAFVAEIFFLYEGQYEMYRQHQITDAMWLPKRDVLLGFLKNPIIEIWWLNRVSPVLSAPFYEYIETCRIELDQIPFSHRSMAEIYKKEIPGKDQLGDGQEEQ